MSVDGPRLFARYALPPNALGYCGPEDTAAFADAAFSTATPVDELRYLAGSFNGAWPYLQLIAGCVGIEDPLDLRVVEAYWIGNRLLDKVDRSLFLGQIDDRFRKRSWRNHELVAAAAVIGHPNHSFHVFCAYPWIGLLRAGKVEPSLRVLDRCRIRWGTVTGIAADHVDVLSQPLVWDGAKLSLGTPVAEAVAPSGDVAVTSTLAVGDTVALHWDYVCDRLSPQRLARLRREHDHHMKIVNRAAGTLGDRLTA